MVSTKKKIPSPSLENRLFQLEEKISQKGIHLHYDLLEAAGLKLKDGMCKMSGEYHLFVDRRKSIPDRIDVLQEFLDRPFPEDIPQNNG